MIKCLRSELQRSNKKMKTFEKKLEEYPKDDKNSYSSRINVLYKGSRCLLRNNNGSASQLWQIQDGKMESDDSKSCP
jgi:hypothetical protein